MAHSDTIDIMDSAAPQAPQPTAKRALPPYPTREPVPGSTRAPRLRAARRAGYALAALTLLAIPATLLVHSDAGAGQVRLGAATFVVVSVLDVVVAYYLWRLTRRRAPRSGSIAAATRVAASAIQGVAAGGLLLSSSDNPGAVARFDSWWGASLLVFGLHLIVLTTALRVNRAPLFVLGGTAAAGAAYLLDALPDTARVLDAQVLLPFMFGELLLLAWLLLVGPRGRVRDTA